MQPFIGEIRLFACNFAPAGWAECAGQLMPISENDALFALIGTTYGGDGQSTFALPDLRGRVPVHQGQGPGLTLRQLGETGGVEMVTLTLQQIPSHTHTVVATTAGASSTTPGNTLLPGTVAGDTFYASTITGNTVAAMSPQSILPAGGSQPHDNMMPTLTAKFCISLFGLYPQP